MNRADYTYGEFPTYAEIKRDYAELMEIAKNTRTIEQAKEVEKQQKVIIEINGRPIDEYENGDINYTFGKPDNKGVYRLDNRGSDEEIEWIRYESYGCLAYVYDRFDERPMFDVWANAGNREFITDITISELTEDFYNKAVEEEKTKLFELNNQYTTYKVEKNDWEAIEVSLVTEEGTKIEEPVTIPPQDFEKIVEAYKWSFNNLLDTADNILADKEKVLSESLYHTNMSNDRLKELLKLTVEHIESFEEDMSQEVLESLGFSENELAEIMTEIKILPEEQRNQIYIKDKLFYNGELIWVLNDYGDNYIFSDQKEDESATCGFITEKVPFKNHAHYIYENQPGTAPNKYICYAWYGADESYIDEFESLKDALEWLAPKIDRSIGKESIDSMLVVAKNKADNSIFESDVKILTQERE